MQHYPSNNYLVNLNTTLPTFITSRLPDGIKPKREDVIKKAYGDCYTAQVAALSTIRNIEVSHLLGMNEVVIPHIVEEYSQLNYALKLIDKNLKSLKQFQELQDILTAMSESLKIKEIGSYLFNDLEFLTDSFDIECDLKAEMVNFKSYKPTKEFLLQLGIKQAA